MPFISPSERFLGLNIRHRSTVYIGESNMKLLNKAESSCQRLNSYSLQLTHTRRSPKFPDLLKREPGNFTHSWISHKRAGIPLRTPKLKEKSSPELTVMHNPCYIAMAGSAWNPFGNNASIQMIFSITWVPL